MKASTAFVGMAELETLSLAYCSLRTLVLKEDVVHHLKLLQMEGNPLRCDCHTRWLWNLAKEQASANATKISLPHCQTPFSARGIALTNLSGEK